MAQVRWAAASAGSGSLLPALAALVVAAALAAVALITVQSAGCADPGYYVAHPGGYELVGGCLEPGDLAIPPERPTVAPGPPSRG